MDMTPQEYQSYVQQRMKKSPLLKDVCLSFVIGGAICVLGQAIQNGWAARGAFKEDAGAATSCTLVFLSALLTGLNLYNKLARFGGAERWCLSPALPTLWFPQPSTLKVRGLSPGMAAKMFTVAGPVITFGTLASVIYGVILMLFQ